MGFSNYKITDKPSDTTKSNLIYITYTKYENDWPSFMHTHPFTELFLVTGGVGEFYVENSIYPLKKGDFILVNPNTSHTEKSAEDNPLEYIAVAVDNFNLNLIDNKIYGFYACRTGRKQGILRSHLSKDTGNNTYRNPQNNQVSYRY